MPISVPDNYPCSICENFAGRYPWQTVPRVHFHVIPNAEREIWGRRLREAWGSSDWA